VKGARELERQAPKGNDHDSVGDETIAWRSLGFNDNKLNVCCENI